MLRALCLPGLLLLAGCAQPDGTDGAAPGPSLSAGPEGRTGRGPEGPLHTGPLPDPVSVAWDGALGTGACAPNGPGSCAGAGIPSPQGTSSWVHELPPLAWNASLAMHWTPTSPATQALRLAFQFYSSCASGPYTCYQSAGGRAAVEGPSPLVLDVRGAVADASADGVWLSVSPVNLAPAPLSMDASVEQPFRVSGRLEPALGTDDG